MTSDQTHEAAADLWASLDKEITGVQVLWETVERSFFQTKCQSLATLVQDIPLLYRLTQTAQLESLLMRASRLMDPVASGRGHGARNNVSLNRLKDIRDDVAADVTTVRLVWDRSNLRNVRDKYLSHNDLARSQTEPHTLSIPLDEADVAAIRELVAAMREFRRKTHNRLNPGMTYLDDSLNLQVRREIDVLSRVLQGGELFFKLLPEHESLQAVWRDIDLKTREEK